MSVKQDMLKTLKTYFEDKDSSREAYASYADKPFSISMINKHFKKYAKMLVELESVNVQKVKSKISTSDSFKASVKKKGDKVE